MPAASGALVDSPDLKYKFLNAFDNAMIELISGVYNFQALPVEKLWEKDDDQVLAYRRGNLVFVFNFQPHKVVYRLWHPYPSGRI